MRRRRSPALVVLAAGLALAACAERTQTRFYTLSPLASAPAEPVAARPGLAVGVGPISLPAYLDRPQLVTRAGANRAVLADYDSWLEPLEGMFSRVLADDLSLLLAADDVVALPQRLPIRLDYQVEVDVNRFDVDTAGNVVLDARWWLLGRNERLLHHGRSTIRESTLAGDPTAGVAALSRALATMSRDIAEAIAEQS